MQMSINVSQNRHGKKFTHLREPGQTFLSPAFCGNPRKAASTSSEKSADWEANEIFLALSDSLLCTPSSSYMCFSHKRCDLIFSLIACVLHHSELLTEGTGPDCSRMPSSRPMWPAIKIYYINGHMKTGYGKFSTRDAFCKAKIIR